MKIFFKIMIILLVAAVVAGGFSLTVNNTSIASRPGGEGGQAPAGISGTKAPARPEGGRNEQASIAGGFAGLLGTLAKLAGISAVVQLFQKAISHLRKSTTVRLA
jgi:hypothetical protein